MFCHSKAIGNMFTALITAVAAVVVAADVVVAAAATTTMLLHIQDAVIVVQLKLFTSLRMFAIQNYQY